jgi:hypothetical protein
MILVCVRRRLMRPRRCYQIPTFTLSGALVYFAAFKKHIGFYPPVRGDAGLEKAVAPYAGEKGNLRFPLDQPIPYGLMRRALSRPYSASALIGRLMSERTASRAGRCWYSTRYAISHSGISTPARAATSWMAPAAA